MILKNTGKIALIGTLLLTSVGCANNATTTQVVDKTQEESQTKNFKVFTSKTMDDAISLFENRESGVIYFGFENCPWCKEAKPILKEVAKKLGKKIYYVKTRDKDNERLYTDEQKEKIQPYIEEYMSENDEGVMTLYVPLVLVVKDGKVIAGHESTVEGHDAHERTMTKKEQKQLKKTYTKMLKKYENSTSSSKGCDESEICR